MDVGIVGCGYWGSKHVRVLHGIPEVDRVVLIDWEAERRTALHQVFPNTIGFATLDEALDHVDAVVIATPPATHAKIAGEAIAAGKHVLVEKPLATNTDDGQRLVRAAEATGVTLMVGHTFEFNPAVRRLREVVRSGELGDIYYLDAARLNLGLYQSDVNVIWDLAPHDVSLANFVLDDTPTAVTAWGSAHAHSRLEDVASLRLEYADSGVVATIRISWLDPCKVRRTTVVGSKKMAVYNDMNDAERLKLYDRGIVPADDSSIHERPLSYRYGDVVAPYVDWQEPLLVEDRHFVESILSGTTPSASGESGLRVVQILEAANESLRTSRAVPLERLDAVAPAI
ncbi:MAG: Gfo/Idh/MocA family oxidoreductase [Actinomycetota bacterium]